jgi:pimeloyl-ACP methyl ester carboxylesterase
LRSALAAALAAALVGGAPGPASKGSGDAPGPKVVRHGKFAIWTIHYRSHTGSRRAAYIVLPRWYGPRAHPRIPLVISPHGRGVSGRANARLWRGLPAVGNFAVVSPDGQGRKLNRYSWGAEGQIADLARMPHIVHAALPWLEVDRHRVYAFGGSMGGQETLLLLARHPRLLAGAAAFDAVADFRLQYRQFPHLRCDGACRKQWVGPLGKSLQSLARLEIGGAPHEYPRRWARRSPYTYRQEIASSCVPLQLWWSPADRVVIDQAKQSGRLFWELRALNPTAPIEAFVGFWIHSREMNANTRLPLALARFGLLPERFQQSIIGLHVVRPPSGPCGRTIPVQSGVVR